MALLLAGCGGKKEDGLPAITIGDDSFYYGMSAEELPEEYRLEGSGSMRRCTALSAVVRDGDIVLINIRLEDGRSAELQNPLNMSETISVDSGMDTDSIVQALGIAQGSYAGSGEVSYCYFYRDKELTPIEKPLREYSEEELEDCFYLTFKYGGDAKITNVIFADRRAAVYFK